MTSEQEGQLLEQVNWLVKIHEGEGCIQVRLLKLGQSWLWITGVIVAGGLAGWLVFLSTKVLGG